MKQFELKFYREWYDALSELSHEERAEAVLASLEYVYEDKLPADRFIRIITVLMRNKIDREKNAHNCVMERKQLKNTPAGNDNGTVEKDSNDTVEENNNEAVKPDITPSPLLTHEEIEKHSIPPEYVHEINMWIKHRFNPELPQFADTAKANNVDPYNWSVSIKRCMIKLIVQKNLEPFGYTGEKRREFFNRLSVNALNAIAETQ